MMKVGSASAIAFDPGPLRASFPWLTSALTRAIELAREAGPPPEDDVVHGLQAAFGLFAGHHSWHAPILDWDLRMTEPRATKTLARLLSHPDPETRVGRLHAFLTALGTPDTPEPTSPELRDATVLAERLIEGDRRIDLEIHLPLPDKPGVIRPIVIEAKFDHKITKRQLSDYRNSFRNRRRYCLKKADFVVLWLSDDETVDGRSARNWRFKTWEDVWLDFERSRPPETDPSLRIFLRMLWRRIEEKRGGPLP